MRFHFDIRPEHHAIYVRYEGRFDFGTLVDTVQKIWADPRYSPEFDGLVDLSDGSLSIDINDLRDLTAYLLREPATSKGRWAAVTNSPLAIACGLVYRTAMRRRHVFAVFGTWEAACGFLNLDPDLFNARTPSGSN